MKQDTLDYLRAHFKNFAIDGSLANWKFVNFWSWSSLGTMNWLGGQKLLLEVKLNMLLAYPMWKLEIFIQTCWGKFLRILWTVCVINQFELFFWKMVKLDENEFIDLKMSDFECLDEIFKISMINMFPWFYHSTIHKATSSQFLGHSRFSLLLFHWNWYTAVKVTGGIVNIAVTLYSFLKWILNWF